MNRKNIMYSAEMANHATQFMETSFGGRYVTRNQMRNMVGCFFAGTKRTIFNIPYATQTEKDIEIHRRESWLNLFKISMGL